MLLQQQSIFPQINATGHINNVYPQVASPYYYYNRGPSYLYLDEVTKAELRKAAYNGWCRGEDIKKGHNSVCR